MVRPAGAVHESTSRQPPTPASPLYARPPGCLPVNKVLILGKYYHPFEGGIEANTASIAKLLAVSNDVTVIANAHSPDCTDDVLDGVKVIRRKVDFSLKSQPISLSHFRDIRLGDYDAIHFHAPNPFVATLLWFRLLFVRRRPALIITHHMEIFGRRLLRLLTIWPYQRLAAMAESVVVTSDKNAAISRDLPAQARPVAIPLGIAAQDYVITDEVRREGLAWRRELVGDAPAVGFLGRHARYKGLDVLVHTLERLPGVHALIAGGGPERAAAELLVEQLGLGDRFHFLGRIDAGTKLKMLSSIDAFIFPSTEITEAFGVSQMEAMLCGAPVVATRLPTGVTDVAIDGETALLAEPGSVDSLTEQVGRMLSDRALAARLGENGRRHILMNMDEAVVARRTCDVIEAAIVERAARSRPAVRSDLVTADA